MTEAGPSFTPESVQKALGLISPDVSSELALESKEADAFYVMGTTLKLDPKEIKEYQDARETSGLLGGRGKNRAPQLTDKTIKEQENKTAIGIVRLVNDGNPLGYKYLQDLYENKDYVGLVRVAAALNKLAFDKSEEAPGVPQTNLGSPDAAPDKDSFFGDLKMAAKAHMGTQRQMPQLLEDAFKDSAQPHSEKIWGIAPVQERLPKEFDFSLESDEDYHKPENAMTKYLNKIHIFVVDMMTRQGSIYQFQRSVLQNLGFFGMSNKDLTGMLPRAVSALSNFTNTLNTNTEKESDRIGGDAPTPKELEAVLQSFRRELAVRVADKEGNEHLIWSTIGTATHLDVLCGNTAEHEVIEQPRFVDLRCGKDKYPIGYNKGEPFTLTDLFLDTSLNLEARIQILGEVQGQKTGWKVGEGVDEVDFDDMLGSINKKGGKKNDKIKAIMDAFKDKKIIGMNDKSVFYKLSDGSVVDLAEVFFTDISIADRQEISKNGELLMGEGVPLYSHPKIEGGKPFFWSTLSEEEQKIFNTVEGGKLLSTGTLGAWHARTDQFSLSHSQAEMYGTIGDGPRTYHAKSFFYDEVRKDIERQLDHIGLTWADVIGFENDMTDGKLADIEHKRVDLVYQSKGGDAGGNEAKEARAKYMLQEMVYARYGAMINAALDIADVTQTSVQHDPALLADNTAELFVKAMMREAYAEKYRMFLLTHRNVITSLIKPLLWWKADYIDPVIASLKGGILKSTWHNYFNPDDTAPTPILTTDSGEHLTAEQKTLITTLFYDKTDHISNWTDRHTQVNYLRTMMEEMRKHPEQRAKFKTTIETFIRGTIDGVVEKYSEESSPQAFPRSRNDALSYANGLSLEQRKKIENVNFEPLLSHLGYKNMNLEKSEFLGWRGLTKLAEVRSMKHFQLGELEAKLFKYDGKYLGASVGAASAIESLFKAITQAEPNWMSKYLGGKPDRLAGFSADDALEGIISGGLEWTLFLNQRTSEESYKYITGIIDAIEEAAHSIGFHDQGTVRTFTLNLISWAISRSNIKDKLPNYDLDGGPGEPGIPKKRIEVDLMPNLSADYDINQWAEDTLFEIESYRQAGCRVIFPFKADMKDFDTWASKARGFDQSLLVPSGGGDLEETIRFGKLKLEAKRLGYEKMPNAYVVTANSPVYKFAVNLDKNNPKKAVPQLISGSGQAIWGHLGGDPLMMAVLINMAKDRNLITKVDGAALGEEAKELLDAMPWYRKVFAKWSSGGYTTKGNLSAESEPLPFKVIKDELDAVVKAAQEEEEARIKLEESP